jgi:hypothetical protein
MTFAIVSTLLQQAGTPDAREQSEIASSVIEFIDSHPLTLPDLWPALDATLSDWRSSPNFPFAASCVLQISGLLLRHLPQKFSSSFLRVSLLPLASSPALACFRGEYAAVVLSGIRHDATNAVPVLSLVLRYWPYVDSTKQLVFLALLGAALPHVPPHEIGRMLPRVLGIIKHCVLESAQGVAELALRIFTDPAMEAFTAAHARTILLGVFNAYHRASRMHWAKTTREAARAALAAFENVEPQFLRQLARDARDGNRKRQDTWQLIAEMAAGQIADRGPSEGRFALAVPHKRPPSFMARGCVTRLVRRHCKGAVWISRPITAEVLVDGNCI